MARCQLTRPAASLKLACGRWPLQAFPGCGSKPVIVHLHANARLLPATLLDDAGQVIHRMALAGLHIMVRIADDVVMWP
jgi:hypothetical protein